MSIMGKDGPKAPFFIPFLVALTFGLPASGIWYAVADKGKLLMSAITMLLGCCCGLGARIAAGGEHPADSAVVATFVLIVVNISAVAVMVLAWEGGHPFGVMLAPLVDHGDFKEFANTCVKVAGRTFIGYPIALYAAYRVSDGT
jgi:hypothetical protein